MRDGAPHFRSRESIAKWMDFARRSKRAQDGRKESDIRSMEAEDLARDHVVNILLDPNYKNANDDEMRGLIHRTARNAIIDVTRRHSKGRRSGHALLHDNMASDALSPDEIMEERYYFELLHHHLENSLATVDRSIMTLYLNGLTDQEIAEAMGQGVGWVKTRKRRARELLKTLMSSNETALH